MTAWICILAGVVAVLIYLWLAWFVLRPEAVWSPDTGAKLLQMVNLRFEEGRLAYDLPYAGRTLDPDLEYVQDNREHGFLTIRNDKVYFQRLPVFPALSALFYRPFGLWGLYLLPAIAGAACGILALFLLRSSDRRPAMWILIAFASPVLIYSTLFWEHTLAAALGLAAAWLSLRAGSVAERPLLFWLTTALALAAAAYVRMETLLFGGALLVAHLLLNPRGRSGALLAGGVLFLLMLPFRPLHSALFGGQPMPDNATYLFYPLRYLGVAGWRAIPELLIGPVTPLSIEPGWIGTLLALAAIVVVAASLLAKDSFARRVVVGVGWLVIIVGVTALLFRNHDYHSVHGLFLTTPWALLGLARARDVWNEGGRRVQILIVTTGLGLLGYVVAMVGFRSSSPHGGLEWGGRFAIIFYPLLALLAGWRLKAGQKRVGTLAVMAALMFLGIAFQLRGLQVIRHDKKVHSSLAEMLVEIPEQVIVTDHRWLPLVSATRLNQKQIYVVDSDEELAGWIERAEDHGIQRFALLTLDPRLVSKIGDGLGRLDLEVYQSLQLENLILCRIRVGYR